VTIAAIVVIGSCSIAVMMILGAGVIDVLVIDKATQSTEN
jgi:hypothetical protein